MSVRHFELSTLCTFDAPKKTLCRTDIVSNSTKCQLVRRKIDIMSNDKMSNYSTKCQFDMFDILSIRQNV